jgi:hypothetical protein
VLRALERRIEIVDVGLVMPAMMDFHRLCIDVRLECVKGIGQRGQDVRHGRKLLYEKALCVVDMLRIQASKMIFILI